MKRISFFLFLSFFLIGAYLLPNYSQNWDEAVHFYRGQAYLNFFLFGFKDYKSIPAFERYYQNDSSVLFDPIDQKKKDVYRRSAYMDNIISYSYFIKDDRGHPPISDIFASAFNFLLFQKLGLINDVDSYHLYSVLLSALLVAVIFWWISKSYGMFAGLIASISFSLFPLFLGETHFNIKDPPETVYYSLTAILFFEGVIRKKNKLLVLSSIFAGFALGTKFNIVFLPFTIIPWLVIYFYSQRTKLKKYLTLLPSILVYPIIPFIIIFALWPYLWQDPIKNLLSIVEYYRSIGTNPSFDPRFLTIFGINTYALQWILFTTPPITLFLSIFGVVFAILNGLKEKDKKLIFILLWFTIPILRVIRPEAGIYGGVRHIMEFIPAISILSGLGALFLREKLLLILSSANIKNKRVLISVLFILLFVPLLLKLISIHPNESIYFNEIAGGLRRAKEMNLPDWGMSLGNPYKKGMQWINDNAEKNARLSTNFGLGSDLPVIFLRPDIDFKIKHRSALERKGEYIIGLTHQVGFEDTYFFKYLDKFLEPLYEEKVDEVPILKIWKNDLAHTRPEYRDYSLLTKNPDTHIEGNTLLIDLRKSYSLAKIEMELADGCVRDQEGSVQISNDNQSWITLDNALFGQFLLPLGTYVGSNEFKYFLAADKGRYLVFNFTSDSSCFKSIEDIKVYGFGD